METLIRQQQSETLIAFTSPLANNLTQLDFFQNKLQQTQQLQTPFFAPISTTPIIMDGYDDEWIIFFEANIQASETPYQLKSATDNTDLYLFIKIFDNDIVYYDPTKAALTNNDWIKLSSADYEYHIFTSAPGNIQSLKYNNKNKTRTTSNSISGFWQEQADGYQLELKIPLTLITAGLNIDIINYNNQPTKSLPKARTAKKTLAPLLIPSKELTDWLTPLNNNAWDIQITNEQGWPLLVQTESNQSIQLPMITRENIGTMLLNRVYRFFLASTLPTRFASKWPLANVQLSKSSQRIPIEKFIGQNHQQIFSQWFSLNDKNQSALLVIQPIINNDAILGYVLATQTEHALLSFTNNALRRVMNLSLLTFLIVVIALLGYAILLSLRIKRLQKTTESAIKENGDIALFQASKTPDEIGQLSQSYAALLLRIKNYNNYLQSLTHKLAHEIRTPLAIVKSSLEMLEAVPKDEQHTYIKRALQGNQRLANILNAMSESTQVEQLVQHAEFHSVDITQLLQDLAKAYETAYPEFNYEVTTPNTPTIIHGNPELLAQMIDKLVDNARDFTPRGDTIKLKVTQQIEGCLLQVINPGSQLPEDMSDELFESLISVRNKKEGQETHLGLGLYIVRLIANAHQGTIKAYNLKNQQAVCFAATFPLQKTHN